jgi:hypothetical protein
MIAMPMAMNPDRKTQGARLAAAPAPLPQLTLDPGVEGAVFLLTVQT